MERSRRRKRTRQNVHRQLASAIAVPLRESVGCRQFFVRYDVRRFATECKTGARLPLAHMLITAPPLPQQSVESCRNSIEQVELVVMIP